MPTGNAASAWASGDLSSYQILYIASGSKLALMNGQSVLKAFVPLPADATAVYVGSTLSYFRHPDLLGSSRFASTPGRTMSYSGAYAPFGEAYAEAGTADRSFTGQNQDTIQGSTTGLYDFLFREYAQYGRWVSPDPAGMAAVNPANPQSWNRYAYVLNNPTGLVDPLGLLCGPGSVALPEGGCGPAPDASSFWCSFFGLGCGSYPRVGPVYTVAEWDDIHGRGPHRPVASQNPPPDVQSTFPKTFPCTMSASELMAAVEADFSRFANYSGKGPSPGFAVFTPGPITLGQQVVIDIGARGIGGFSNYVTVTSQTSTSFTFTVSGNHFFVPGSTVSFAAADVGNGYVNFTVSLSGNWASFGWRSMGSLIKAGESATWNNLENNLQQFCSAGGG